MPNELKPCPFCGTEAKMYNLKVIGGYDYSFAKCPKCGIRTKEYQVSTDYCSSDKAAEDWNRRADNAIKEAPSADVAEVVHSKWIKRNNERRCPICHFFYMTNGTTVYNFCPMCGAKMGEINNVYRTY